MTITLQDLLNDRTILDRKVKGDVCCECGEPIQTFLTGRRPTPKGVACDDCYFGLLGDEVEQHPIGGGAPKR